MAEQTIEELRKELAETKEQETAITELLLFLADPVRTDEEIKDTLAQVRVNILQAVRTGQSLEISHG